MNQYRKDGFSRYRAYVLDLDGDISAPPHDLHCSTDEEAVDRARPLLDDRAIEVWSSERLVARLEPQAARGAAASGAARSVG
jgi:hypothetical protein